MKVRTLSAQRFGHLVRVSVTEPQTKAETSVYLTLEELQRAVSGLLAIQRSLEADARKVA